MISNKTLCDTSLRLDALGLLCYLLSKPDDWTVSMQALAKEWGIGKEKLRAIMKNLQKAGYADLKIVRDEDTGKVEGKQWVVYERPQLGSAEEREIRLSGRDRKAGNPDVGEKPMSVKPAQLVNTEVKDYQKLNNKPKTDTSSRPSGRPRLEEDVQEVREYLNQKCGRRFPPDSGQMKYIRARLKEGKPKEHLKLIVDYFAREWGDDDKMRVYLRPATLFSKEHYDEYYERALEWKEKGRPPKRNGNGKRLANAARIEEDLNQAVARLCGRGT